MGNKTYSNAGGFGACGALLMDPEAIKAWIAEFRHAEFRQKSKGFLAERVWSILTNHGGLCGMAGLLPARS